MKFQMLALLVVAGLIASPAVAQDKKEGGDKQEKKNPPTEKKEGDKKDGDKREGEKKDDCTGMDAKQLQEKLKGKAGSDDDLRKNIAEHLKKHADGPCHCMCSHAKPAKKDGEKPKKDDCKGDDEKNVFAKRFEKLKEFGCDPEKVKKEIREHFKENHKDAESCHCDCDHDKGGGKDGKDKSDGKKDAKQKGNNGVGNGQDPQPPGNPPQNDGKGTGPGNPGNKGGPK